jgi:hypothetical protein
MKTVLIVYVISWLIVLGAVVVRAIRNGLNYFKKDPWYFYLLLFALAPFCILFIVIPSALMNCFNKNKRKAKSDAGEEAEEIIDYVDNDYGNWFK